MSAFYQLWCRDGGNWCEQDIVGESHYHRAHRALLPPDWSGEGTEVIRDFELIAEPANPYDPWAVSIRADGNTIGYLPKDDAPLWAPVVRRVMASGLIPVTKGRMYAFIPHRSPWNDDEDDFGSTIRLKLDEPSASLPINNPPTVPYTLLPRSTWVQVAKEHEHREALQPHVPSCGDGRLFVTLHENDKEIVGVRINDAPIGQLSPQMGQRYLPLIRHFAGRGLTVACRADITGSALAAEVRISAVKSHEADPELLHGDPITLPSLIPAVSDPAAYDLSRMGHVMQPQTPTAEHQPGRIQVSTTQQPPLPPEGWYQDPSQGNRVRYWNGTAWTRHTALRP